MATINPFYRFEDAIQVGSLGERGRIISLALDGIYNTINVSQVGLTLAQVLATCNGLAAQYNDDLNANIVVDCFYNTDPTIPYPVQIFIYDSVVAVQYPLLKVSLVLIIDPNTNQVTTSSAWFMGSVPANYNYSEPLCADELEAYNALIQYAQTGSAIFPRTYQFDAQTGIASSLVARLRPCKYNAATGAAERFPADTYARSARPNLQFAKLSAAGAYVIKLFNSLIELAKTPGTTITNICDAPLIWSLPDGFFLSRDIDTTGIERTQINIYSANEGFSLVVRDDNGFEFQRFYAPQYAFFNFLTNYVDGLDLPYQPDEFYKYGGIFYDFDFCEFNNCAYPAKESYPMPSKSGDEYQFNVLPYQSNVLPYDNVNIGLFDKDFNLVQKVGEAIKLQDIACTEFKCSHEFVKTYSYSEFGLLIDSIEETMVNIGGFEPLYTTYIQFTIRNSEDVIIEQIQGVLNSDDGSISRVQYVNFLVLRGFVVTTEGSGSSTIYTIKYLIDDLACDDTYTFKQFAGYPEIDTFIMEFDEFECECPLVIREQKNANALIPPIKNDCYRFGLYQFENNSFGATIDFETTSIFPVSNSQFHVLIISDAPPVTSIKYMIVLPFYVVTFSDFVNYINGIFPNSITQNPSDPNPFFQLCGYNTQFTTNDAFYFGTYDFTTDTFVDFNFGEISIIQCSEAEENISEIYSFSNLISLDNSDCFSTMIQFWAESNAIAQGFEYYNDWFQQVRLGINGGGQKPIITESTYRQSNGVTRRPQNKQDLSIDLHTDFLDLETQSALVDATRHTNFVVDGRNLFVNGDIDVATIQDFTTQSSFEDLAQVKFSALIQGFQPKNSTCVNC